jgi:hypothetical protein
VLWEAAIFAAVDLAWERVLAVVVVIIVMIVMFFGRF